MLNLTAKLFTYPISKVYYLKSEELVVRFRTEDFTGYDTAVFTDVDKATVEEFRNATDKNTFFRENIRRHFKMYLSDFSVESIRIPNVIKERTDKIKDKNSLDIDYNAFLKTIDNNISE